MKMIISILIAVWLSAKVTPQRLQGSQRGERCGFGAQHPWTESCRREAGAFRGLAFVLCESAFGADQQGDAGLPLQPGEAACSIRRKQQSRPRC